MRVKVVMTETGKTIFERACKKELYAEKNQPEKEGLKTPVEKEKKPEPEKKRRKQIHGPAFRGGLSGRDLFRDNKKRLLAGFQEGGRGPGGKREIPESGARRTGTVFYDRDLPPSTSPLLSC